MIWRMCGISHAMNIPLKDSSFTLVDNGLRTMKGPQLPKLCVCGGFSQRSIPMKRKIGKEKRKEKIRDIFTYAPHYTIFFFFFLSK